MMMLLNGLKIRRVRSLKDPKDWDRISKIEKVWRKFISQHTASLMAKV